MKKFVWFVPITLFITAACAAQEAVKPVAADAAAVVSVESTTNAEQGAPIQESAPPSPKDVCKVSLKEISKQQVDETMASAAKLELALSDFYKKPEHAAIFAFSLDFARSQSQKLYLGLLEDKPCYRGKRYIKHPDKAKVFREMLNFYKARYGPDPDKADKKLLSLLEQKAKGK